jgi:hypothetical protein
MIPNVRPSQLYPVKGAVSPQSVAKNTPVTSGATWIAVPPGSKWLKLTLLIGSAGGCAVTVDTLQATAAAGTGSKALVSALIVSATTDTQQIQAEVNLDATLDVAGGFGFVQVKATTDNVGAGPALLAVSAEFGPNEFAG